MNCKPIIYVDCDDTILNSSKTVIRILNQRYGANKTMSDLNDWSYQSIVPGVTQNEILGIYESDEFWKDVQLNTEFLKVFHTLKDKFCWKILSRGTKKNLEQKKLFVDKYLHIPFIGLPITSSKQSCATKEFDMVGCIQIDDHMGCLQGSSASVKLLLQNGRLQSWNQPEPNEDNLYTALSWDEIETMLEFFSKFPHTIESCYGEV